MPDLQNVVGVGINTSYDSANKLAVKEEATLLDNDGNGHQLKLNKAVAGDTAALLFQTGYAGRAEMGRLGSDDFGVKVSPDGTAWNTALSANATTGGTTIAQLGLGAALAPASGGTGVTPAAQRDAGNPRGNRDAEQQDAERTGHQYRGN